MTRGNLVAVRLPPGGRWPSVVAGLWEAGAAVLPVDHRLPGPRVEALLALARPTHVLAGDGLRAVEGGVPSDPAVAVVVATSGTGGAARLVELSGDAVDAAVRASAEALGAGPDEGWLCVLPVAHIGGLLVVLRGVLLGVPVSVHPRFDPETFEADRKAAFVSVVPTMLARLLGAGADLGRFRAVLVGGAALSPSLGARAGAARVVEGYGLTESCGGVVYDGRPFSHTEVRIGDDGEILLRGPTLMRGYRLDPESTAAAFTAEGWLRTGDAGRLVDGRLSVLGRLDDLILTGGEKVWPEEVEAVLREHKGVGDAAVVGRPDPEWGQRVEAFVVPASASDPPVLEDLRAAVAERLAAFKAPRRLRLVGAIPRTRSGKVRRDLLGGNGAG